MNRAILFLLSVFLVVWEPANLASELLGAMGTLSMRGVAGAVELAAHAAVATLTVVAGLSLRAGTPHAPALAQAALLASALRTVQSLYWSALPHQTVPGEALPLSAIAIVHAAAWIVYLRRSRYVRSLYD